MKKITVKTVFNVILTVFMVIVGVFIAIMAFQKITGKKVIPYSVIWVLTPSMEDTIPQKSYILVKQADTKDIKVGDVITFRSRNSAISGELNTHRVFEIIGDNEEFITKGDANPVPDKEHVYPGDIEAKYIKNLPVLSFFGRVFTTTAGFVICMALMFVGTVFWFYRYFFSKKKAAADGQTTGLDSAEFDRLVEEEIKRLEAQNADGAQDLSTENAADNKDFDRNDSDTKDTLN